MTRLYKIIIIISIFLVSASVAWGFNYDSSNNNFIFDNLSFKSHGNYMIIGDGFDSTLETYDPSTDSSGTTNDFFAITNNLIFFGNDTKFSTTDDTRQMGWNLAEGSYFTSNKIVVRSDPADFIISSGGSAVIFETPIVRMKNDFYISDGLTFQKERGITQIDDGEITVNKVLANKFLLDGVTEFSFSYPETRLVSLESNSASASEIIVGSDSRPFCKVISWSIQNDLDNKTADIDDKPTGWTNSPAGDQPNNLACAEAGGLVVPPTALTSYANKVCCPKGYFVFDLNATDGNTGKIVCCMTRM